jgi:hypothetical protein
MFMETIERQAEPTGRGSHMGTIRPGSKTLETVLKTDELYGHDGLWLGPRGRDYGAMLPNPKPYQHANLYPDPNSTYWFAIMEMPAGSVLTISAQYPHCRYFQFALYRSDPDMGGFTATGEKFVDHQIAPDEGSVNPFVPGTDRSSETRDYTLRIANIDPPEDPADRATNTLYAGAGNKIQVVYRVYQPDQGYLGDGGVGLPAYTATLADGTKLSADEIREKFNRPLLEGVAPGMPVDKWVALCAAPDNDPDLRPETTPARNPAVLERYFNNAYNLVGVFKSPEVRAARFPAKVETGFGGDPETLFLMAFLSRAFGPVVVVKGKMPLYPDNWYGEDGAGLKVMTDWECRYMSLIVSEAPPSGMGTDGISDFQIPLDDDRNYTIVVCREEDRPTNATDENGVAWVDFGHKGEGIDDPRNREDFAILLFRFMHTNPDWKYDPQQIVEPGTEEAVMGPYFPRITYTDKVTFEAESP